ncbi:hypothetical protein HY639_02440 [Candidatus Woesearchaeota archaeon]|nr:hypothetical protein [Candidatus Woesearchaeota archaeon]
MKTFIALSLIVLIFAIGYVDAYECKMTCTVCLNQKTACPDTPNRQMDGHQKKMHECGQDCCLHTYIGDLQTRHAARQPGKDHRETPEYDSKQNVNGKKPECKGEDDCCHNVYDQIDAQMKQLESDPSCDTKEGKPRCDAQCQQINQQCDQMEQQCQQKGQQAKQQYQQQKKGDETHDQELNECFDRFQKTVEVEKDKQYDLTTPQVNDILDKKNKIAYVTDERTSGEHECEHMLLDDGNKYKKENIESFDEGKKKILDETGDDVLRKSPQDEFMTPECIAKAMHEKEKPRLSEKVFNAQCRADEEKQCPIAADVVLKRQADLNNERHKKNIESAKQKTQEKKQNETNGTIDADLAYLYYLDKEVSKNFEIADKNPHRVSRIRKNKEAKKPGVDRPPKDSKVLGIFNKALEKVKEPKKEESLIFSSMCPEKTVALPGSHVLYGWGCTEQVHINPLQQQEAKEHVDAAQKQVFFADHWQTILGGLNVVTDQPAKIPLLYTGASQPYRDLIASLDAVWFGESIHIIRGSNMFTLDGWLNNGVVDHDTYYTLSIGGKTTLSVGSPQGQFFEDGYNRFFWAGPGTTLYTGDFIDKYSTNTNIWYLQGQVIVQQPDERKKPTPLTGAFLAVPAFKTLAFTFDHRRFSDPDGADITMTSPSWVTLLPHGVFDLGFVSDLAGIFPLVVRNRALGDADIVYNPGVQLLKAYTVRDEKDYLYSIRSYGESTKVHTGKNFIIEDSASKPIIDLTARENRLVYELRKSS